MKAKIIKYTRLNGDVRRDKLVNVAKKIFAKKGYTGTKVSDIVNGANISRATFYLYFKNKQGIFSEIANRVVNELREAISTGRENNLDVIDNIKRIIFATFKFCEQNKDIYSIFYREKTSTHPFVKKKINEIYKILKDEAKQVFKTGIEKGKLKPLNLDIITNIAISLIDGIISEYLVIEGKKSIPDEVIDTLLEFCFYGMIKKEV